MAGSVAARRRGVAIALTLSMLASGLSYVSFALLAPIAPVTPVISTVDAVTTPAGSVTLPEIGGAAIAAADGEQIFAARELDTPRTLASIAKVITALVVLDAYPIAEGSPGASITLTAADSALPARYRAINGSVAPAPQGTTLTQRTVIELMMVPSANNYAETLAVWAFGSNDAYLAAARAWLDERGLQGITIGDSTGFSLDNTGSPRALVALARLALDSEVVARAAALSEVSAPGVGTFPTTNLALGLGGVTGLKTGTLVGIGANLLFSGVIDVNGEPIEVVGVVLGVADQRAASDAVLTLISTASDDFRVVPLAEQSTTVVTYTTPWGDRARFEIAEAATALVWGESRARAIIDAPFARVGEVPATTASLTMLIAGQREEIDLVWAGSLDPPPLEWRLAQPLAALFGG